MDITTITSKLRVSKRDLIKAQLLMRIVFLQRKHISEADLDILTLLGIAGPIELSKFCEDAAGLVYKDTTKALSRLQNIRNRLVVLERQGYVTKKVVAKKPKMLSLTEPVSCTANTMLEYKLLYLESN